MKKPYKVRRIERVSVGNDFAIVKIEYWKQLSEEKQSKMKSEDLSTEILIELSDYKITDFLKIYWEMYWNRVRSSRWLESMLNRKYSEEEFFKR